MRAVLACLAALTLLAGCTAPLARTAATPAAVAADDSGGGRIIGGKRVDDPQAVQWQAELFATWGDDKLRPGENGPEARHQCGGALIATEWVITAAHCVATKAEWEADFKTKRRVRLGTHNLAAGGMVFDIAEVIVHPDYVPPFAVKPGQMVFASDIALLRLAVPVVLDGNPVKTIRLLDLARGDPPLAPGQRVTVTGWGSADNRDTDPARAQGKSATFRGMEPDLLIVGLAIKPDIACRNLRLPPSHFCAGEVNKDSCSGDSGGPLVRQTDTGGFRLAGIVSYGPRDYCGGVNAAGAYTRVSDFTGWVRATLAARGTSLP